MHKSFIIFKQVDELLDFLSYYCQIISLDRLFLYISFSFHHVVERWYRFSRTCISSKVKWDLRWWNILLENWFSHSITSKEWYIYEIWIDVNDKKKIEDWNKFKLFSIQVLSHHRKKYINFKEMFIILHIFILWHEQWSHEKLILYYDNINIMQGINKRSIRDSIIRLLQIILLIATIFDIKLIIIWIFIHENMITDIVSWYNFYKLRKLELIA